MEQKIEASRQKTAANEKRLKEWQNMSPCKNVDESTFLPKLSRDVESNGDRWASRLGKIMGSKDYIIEEIPPKVYAAVRYNAEGESWEGAC